MHAQPRVALVSGRRTPFVKAQTHFRDFSAVDLTALVLREAIASIDLAPALIDEVIMGCVLPPVAAPNVAREGVLQAGLPRQIPGYTVNRACTSSLQAAMLGAQSIRSGQARVVVAGGVESLSQFPIPYSHQLIRALQGLREAEGLPEKVSAVADLPWSHLLPATPAIAEASTGSSMGQHAEAMGRRFGVSREAQDAWALRSHQRAANATASGRMGDEIMPVWLPSGEPFVVSNDNGIRPTTSMEKLANLKPAFDPPYGAITAGNASPLTDGAAALVLMDEYKAAELGYRPLAWIKAWSTVAVDPAKELLIGPALAMPKVLDQTGLTLADMGVVELHEAFAAQTVATLKALASPSFAAEWLSRPTAVGTIPDERLNVDGGSIAIGHPFGATGARLLLHAALTLRARGEQFALVSACAAGGQGMAVILERADD